MIAPSCPVFVIHENDEFRNRLIKALDQTHFAVTFSPDGEGAVGRIDDGKFNVIIVGVNVQSKLGSKAIDHLARHHERLNCGVILLGDPDPAIRTYAPWADETLMKPVDPEYVAKRARTYCGC